MLSFILHSLFFVLSFFMFSLCFFKMFLMEFSLVFVCSTFVSLSLFVGLSLVLSLFVGSTLFLSLFVGLTLFLSLFVGSTLFLCLLGQLCWFSIQHCSSSLSILLRPFLVTFFLSISSLCHTSGDTSDDSENSINKYGCMYVWMYRCAKNAKKSKLNPICIHHANLSF